MREDFFTVTGDEVTKAQCPVQGRLIPARLPVQPEQEDVLNRTLAA